MALNLAKRLDQGALILCAEDFVPACFQGKQFAGHRSKPVIHRNLGRSFSFIQPIGYVTPPYEHCGPMLVRVKENNHVYCTTPIVERL